jgi:hypothetical protein
MNMVASYLARHDYQLVFRCYLADQVAHTDCHGAFQHFLPVLGYPDQVHFQVVLCVRAQSVLPHATMLPKLRFG